MHTLIGITLILYMLKLSAGKGLLLYTIVYLWYCELFVVGINHSKKDGGMSILLWSFVKSKFYVFKNGHKINILERQNQRE